MQPKISSPSYAMFLSLLCNVKLLYKFFFVRDHLNPVEERDHFMVTKSKYLPLEIQIYDKQLGLQSEIYKSRYHPSNLPSQMLYWKIGLNLLARNYCIPSTVSAGFFLKIEKVTYTPVNKTFLIKKY